MVAVALFFYIRHVYPSALRLLTGFDMAAFITWELMNEAWLVMFYFEMPPGFNIS